MYKFNDYMTGHNPSNFIDFKHTPEQIVHRNECIKKTYEGNKELRHKIGNAVSVAFKDPVKNKNLSDGQKRGWAKDPARKLAMSKRNGRLLELGIIGPQAPFKTEWKFNPFTGKEEFMHSSWETLFLDAAVAAGVHTTKSHQFQIPYRQSDGTLHTYYPDFACSELKMLCEIKGGEGDIDRLKYVAAEEWCDKVGWTYVILRSENDIAELFK